eukprot:1179137-Prorocentrum_minimum.AAC.3
MMARTRSSWSRSGPLSFLSAAWKARLRRERLPMGSSAIPRRSSAASAGPRTVWPQYRGLSTVTCAGVAPRVKARSTRNHIKP